MSNERDYVKTLQAERNKLNAEIADQKTYIDAIDKRVSDLQAEIERLTVENERQRELIGACNFAVVMAEQLKKENERLTTELDEVNQQCHQLDDLNEKQLNDIQRLTTELDDVKLDYYGRDDNQQLNKDEVAAIDEKLAVTEKIIKVTRGFYTNIHGFWGEYHVAGDFKKMVYDFIDALKPLIKDD